MKNTARIGGSKMKPEVTYGYEIRLDRRFALISVGGYSTLKEARAACEAFAREQGYQPPPKWMFWTNTWRKK